MELPSGKDVIGGIGKGLEKGFEKGIERPVVLAAQTSQKTLGGIGDLSLDLFAAVGDVTRLFWSVCERLAARRWPVRQFMDQMFEIGIKSIGIALIASVFTGMVLALQLAEGLARFGAKTYVGTIVSFAFVRELGPVLTSLLVGGRVGAGITAEIGSMTVTEQVDAMRGLGADPVRLLVLPRVLACAISFPLLTVFSNILGIAGGMLISYSELGISSGYFFETATRSLRAEDILQGVSKTVFFGLFVALIACRQGLATTGGTEGLGQSTKVTVMVTLVVILISDFILTKILMMMF